MKYQNDLILFFVYFVTLFGQLWMEPVGWLGWVSVCFAYIISAEENRRSIENLPRLFSKTSLILLYTASGLAYLFILGRYLLSAIAWLIN